MTFFHVRLLPVVKVSCLLFLVSRSDRCLCEVEQRNVLPGISFFCKFWLTLLQLESLFFNSVPNSSVSQTWMHLERGYFSAIYLV